jgi:hypothetical protein
MSAKIRAKCRAQKKTSGREKKPLLKSTQMPYNDDYQQIFAKLGIGWAPAGI